MPKPKIVIAVNTAWNLVNFRSDLMSALDASGYEVVAMAPADGHESKLPALNVRFLHVPMDQHGTRPHAELALAARFLRQIRREQPDVFLAFTVKPNIYGSIACHILGIPVINNVAGLGNLFARNNWLTSLVKQFYRVAFSRSRTIFFQNTEDYHSFLDDGLLSNDRGALLPGSGVNLRKFSPTPLPSTHNSRIRFTLIGRLLWQKGVGEFVEAAKQLKPLYPQSEFCLLGFVDEKNPHSISRKDLEAWSASGAVKYLGSTDDVASALSDTDCVVLPSYYREGVPKALLEGLAMGRPIVTTDNVGCRDVVDDGVNGYICRVRDAADLADKMEKILLMTAAERTAFGKASRAKAERQFDSCFVVDAYLEKIASIAPVSMHDA